MRHRVAVTGSSETARSVALLLVARDDCHVLLTGEDGTALQAAATALRVEPRVEGPVDVTALTGAAIVVACDVDEALVREVRDRAPAALLVVATDAPEADGRAMQHLLRWPRQRVIGIDPASAAAAATQRAAAAVRLVDHILADRGHLVEATVQCTADGDDSWNAVEVNIDARGIAGFGG